jgi:hypothetical protein
MELLNYNQSSGEFIWKTRPVSHFKSMGACKAWNTRYSGKPAGYINEGYRLITIDCILYSAHRLAWFYIHKVWPTAQIDHKDTIKCHNWIDNLRDATHPENQQNLQVCRSTNKSSGLLGVSFNKKSQKYTAQIMLNSKNKHLGCFTNADEAHQAYVVAKRSLHPFGEL